MKPVRAIALGYQGFGNLGDEAILTGLETLLAGSPVEVRAVVCGAEAVPAFPRARRLRTRRMRPTIAALRALRRARLLIVSGGGLLHDHWLSVVPTYLAWSLLARAFGVRIAWVGVGIGPLDRPLARRLAGWTLRLADLVTVRDDASAELARAVAPGATVHVAADPAIFNTAPVTASDAAREGVALIVRGPTPRDAGHAAQLAQALADTASRIPAEGLGTATIVTFAGDGDAPFASRVAELAAAGGSVVPILALPPDPGAAISSLRAFTAIVSVRLHGILLGALAETPTVAIAYDPKVAAAAERLGMAERSVSLAEARADLIVARLHEAIQPHATLVVRARLDELRASGPGLRALIEGAAR